MFMQKQAHSEIGVRLIKTKRIDNRCLFFADQHPIIDKFIVVDELYRIIFGHRINNSHA